MKKSYQFKHQNNACLFLAKVMCSKNKQLFSEHFHSFALTSSHVNAQKMVDFFVELRILITIKENLEIKVLRSE